MLSIIIPIYNERDNVRELHARVTEEARKLHTPYELLLIDDGSKDGSAGILDELAAGDEALVVIHLARNCGQTAALMAGIDNARGEIIIPMDGDLQNDPADIGRLLAKLDEGYDVVSGWRKDRKDAELTRNLPSHIANRLISFVSGVRLHDYGCSLKAYRREVLDGVRIYGEMHRFIPIYASWQGARVTEMPVTHHPRMHGKSKYGLERIFKVLLDLCVVKFLDRHLVKPIYVFGGFGLFAVLLSLLTLLWALGLKFFGDTSLIQTPLPTFAGLSFLLGINSILMGLLAEVLSRTYFEAQDKKSYKIRNIIRGVRDKGESADVSDACR